MGEAFALGFMRYLVGVAIDSALITAFVLMVGRRAIDCFRFPEKRQKLTIQLLIIVVVFLLSLFVLAPIVAWPIAKLMM